MANFYFAKRMKEHKQRQAKVRAAQRERERHDRLVEVEAHLTDYERAYEEVNLRKCHLVYRGGWVRMAECGTFRVRLKVLGALAQELRDEAAHGVDAPLAID
jgi:hypothetical protein